MSASGNCKSVSNLFSKAHSSSSVQHMRTKTKWNSKIHRKIRQDIKIESLADCKYIESSTNCFKNIIMLKCHVWLMNFNNKLMTGWKETNKLELRKLSFGNLPLWSQQLLQPTAVVPKYLRFHAKQIEKFQIVKGNNRWRLRMLRP